MTKYLSKMSCAALAAMAALAACSDRTITGPDALVDDVPVERSIPPAQVEGTASARWNAVARDLVAARRIDPPMAARIYAMLGVSQYAAVTDVVGAERNRGASAQAAIRVAVISASAGVLATEFPGDVAFIRSSESLDVSSVLDHVPSKQSITRALGLGRAAAERVIARAARDGSGLAWTGTVPVGPGLWIANADNAPPLRPTWGQVRPWLLRSGDQFRPPPPPSFGSAEFTAALREVRTISDTRSAEQSRIATFWSDGLGTATPPGHWNAIAAELIGRHHESEERAALTFALLNMSLMDAGIACWDAKYHYWLIRPSQADPLITTPVGLPYFPSYVSGHASFSGAASTVLAALFPGDRRNVEAMANEAALSRLYGGIHYRFDNERGLELGRRIGALAVALIPRGNDAIGALPMP